MRPASNFCRNAAEWRTHRLAPPPEPSMTSLRLFAAACVLLAASLPPPAIAGRSEDRNAFRAAYAAATRPPEDAWKRHAAALDAGYPLYPYIELAALRAKPQRLHRREVERFLER